MNIGYIYKITNLINGKIYIGQTTKTIKKRFKEHIIDSKNPIFPLHKAINKYGIENFIVEEIEKCEIDRLNEREVYWINYYDSFNNGYNQTLGGGGLKLYNFDEDKVILKYNELESIQACSNYFNCSPGTIQIILEKNNVKYLSALEFSKKMLKQ